jgi:hypothetical protein
MQFSAVLRPSLGGNTQSARAGTHRSREAPGERCLKSLVTSATRSRAPHGPLSATGGEVHAGIRWSALVAVQYIVDRSAAKDVRGLRIDAAETLHAVDLTERVSASIGPRATVCPRRRIGPVAPPPPQPLDAAPQPPSPSVPPRGVDSIAPRQTNESCQQPAQHRAAPGDTHRSRQGIEASTLHEDRLPFRSPAHVASTHPL